MLHGEAMSSLGVRSLLCVMLSARGMLPSKPTLHMAVVCRGRCVRMHGLAQLFELKVDETSVLRALAHVLSTSHLLIDRHLAQQCLLDSIALFGLGFDIRCVASGHAAIFTAECVASALQLLSTPLLLDGTRCWVRLQGAHLLLRGIQSRLEIDEGCLADLLNFMRLTRQHRRYCGARN